MPKEEGQEGLIGISLSALSQDFVRDRSSNLAFRKHGESVNQQGEHVVYSFYEPEVRRKLMKLINTDVIRIMDKKFMNNLQEKLYESYWLDFEERLEDRRKKEAERRKKLALRGIQSLDDNALDQHPIMEVSRRVEKDVDQWKKKNRKVKHRPHVDPWEFRQFLTLSELESERSELSLVEQEIADKDWMRACERRLDVVRREALEIGVLPSPEIIENLKYEPPLIKELRQLHTVEDLYRMAEQILPSKLTKPPESQTSQLQHGEPNQKDEERNESREEK